MRVAQLRARPRTQSTRRPARPGDTRLRFETSSRIASLSIAFGAAGVVARQRVALRKGGERMYIGGGVILLVIIILLLIYLL